MATKVSLRQFQQDLAQRLSSAKDAPASSARLGVQCGKGYWLIDLEDAGEIVPVPELTEVPLTKPWFLGMANIRGSLFSVVDFSAFSGQEPTARSTDNRLVLAGSRFGINAALLVSRMLGLRSPRGFQSVPESAEAAAWAGQMWHEGGGASETMLQMRTWRELKMEHLVEDPGFLNVGA
jgi:twitching motility protein PilI